MKKLLVLAVAAAAVSSGANAAFDSGVSTSNSTGEMVLTMWNADGKSFAQDLNAATSEILMQTGVLNGSSFTVSQAGLDHLGTASPIKWTVAGINGDKTNDVYGKTDGPAESWRNNRGFVSTMKSTPIDGPLVGETQTGYIAPFSSLVSLMDTAAKSGEDVYLLTGLGFSNPAWGETFGGFGETYSFLSGAGIGDGVMDVYGIRMNDDKSPTGNGPDHFQSFQAGTFTLSGNQLTFDAVAEVPVPAAAWLFGSALVGLAGVGRKRKVFVK